MHEGERKPDTDLSDARDPNLTLPVYDFNRGDPNTGGHCFYTMRFVRGQTLREVIAAFHAEREAQRSPLLGHFTSISGG